MSKPNKYIKGNHWVHCQRCAAVKRSTEVRREWTGLIVCKECWEPRHEQDFVRARPDRQAAKGLVVPEPPDTYITGYCTPTLRNGVAGITVAGCAVAGGTSAIPEGTFDGSL